MEVQIAQLVEYSLLPTIIIQDESQLPTYEQAVEQDLIDNNGNIKCDYATLEGYAWYGTVDSETIVWSDYSKYNQPINIIDKTYSEEIGLFVRQDGGEVIETSYWVYSDGEWYNVDELGNGNTCSIFVEFYYDTNYINQKWSAPKLSEVITECNYTIKDLENYDYEWGDEGVVYATVSTGIISGLPITSVQDDDFTEIVFKVPYIDVFAGEIYVEYCNFNESPVNMDENNRWHANNYVGGYLKIRAGYRALS